MPMKNPLTLAGIEPATFRFVAQHFNHCATAGILPIYRTELLYPVMFRGVWCDVVWCVMYIGTDVSEKRTAYIFMFNN